MFQRSGFYCTPKSHPAVPCGPKASMELGPAHSPRIIVDDVLHQQRFHKCAGNPEEWHVIRMPQEGRLSPHLAPPQRYSTCISQRISENFSYCHYFWQHQRTWILHRDLTRSLDMMPILKPMPILNTALTHYRFYSSYEHGISSCALSFKELL